MSRTSIVRQPSIFPMEPGFDAALYILILEHDKCPTRPPLELLGD